MTLRTGTVSVWFLLAVTASVVATSTPNWQTIQLDIVPVDDVADTARSHAHPHHRRDPPRQRRMLTDFDRQSVIDTLNRLRRSLAAPDMYYVVCLITVCSSIRYYLPSHQIQGQVQVY